EGTLFSEARQQAIEIVNSLPPSTLVGAVTIGDGASRLTPSLEASSDSVARALEAVEQSHGTTDLAGGLREARRMLGGEGGEILVLTDEAGPTAVPAAREEIGLLARQGAALVPRPLRPEDPANVAIVDATFGEGPEGGTVRVRVVNYGSETREVPVTVRLPDGNAITAFVETEPGATAEDQVTIPRVASGGVATAEIEDPELAADNSFAFHLPQVGASRVLVVDGDPGPTPVASEVYFLERALAPWGALAATRGGVLPDITAAAGIEELDPETHKVVFLANVADPGPLAARLFEFVNDGGGLVLTMGDNVTAERYNSALKALLPAPLRRPRALSGQGEEGAATALPHTDLDLFAPFSRGGREAFERVRWRTLFTLETTEPDEAVRTLLSTEGGLPVLVERKLGRGRILLWTGSIDLDWGNLPLQAVFMPLIQRTVGYLGGASGSGGVRMDAQVGDTVAAPIPDLALDLAVQGPSGSVEFHVENGRVVFTPRTAGAYEIVTPGSPALAQVAVNVDTSESDVRSGPGLVEVAAKVDPERFLQRRNLAPWMLWAVLVLSLVQVLLSIRNRVHTGTSSSTPDHTDPESSDESLAPPLPEVAHAG
ncbi:MAG: VWA domain-containing protein, partial [Myxococcota bacterium]|nr:VWA domain-containing protein [Myxococcota bacterium]